MKYLSPIVAALVVAASILGGAHMLKPLTPTDKCWDISVTWERQQKAGAKVFGTVDSQEIYVRCLTGAWQHGGN